MRISIVGPAYNEAGNLPLFVEKVDRAFKAQNLSGELIIVNDASTDGTKNVAEQLRERYPFIRVVSRRKRGGLTGASWTGFTEAKEDILVLLPTDLESDPEEDLPVLLEPLRKDEADLVVGWRQGKKTGMIKSVTSGSFNLAARVLFKVHVHDMGWVKAFRREILDDIEALRSDWHRLLVVQAAYEGYRIKEVRTNFHPRLHGKSHYKLFGLTRIPGGVFDMLVLKYHHSFSHRPMFIFGSLGAGLVFTGLALGLYEMRKFLFLTDVPLNQNIVLSVVLLLILGTQFFGMGFLAEFLVSMREDIRRRRR